MSDTNQSEKVQSGEPVPETDEPEDTQTIEMSEKVIKNKKGANMKKSWKQWFVLGLMCSLFIFFYVSAGGELRTILFFIATIWFGAEFLKWISHT